MTCYHSLDSVRCTMMIDLDKLYLEHALTGEYRKLYEHLCELTESEWCATFSQVEAIVGFKLPRWAREYSPWWYDSGFDQVRACLAAGWKVAKVDIEAETVLFWRKDSPAFRNRGLDEVWPARSLGPWPEGLSLRREDLYDERL